LGKPKWLLTHPDGLPVGLKSILGLDLNQFDRIIFVGLLEHENQYKYKSNFQQYLSDLGYVSPEFHLLDRETNSQSQTVALAIKECKIQGLIFVKDADGYYEYKEAYQNNTLIVSNIHDSDVVDPHSKSYVSTDSNDLITNIAEKSIISEKFCVGGYIFEDSQEFLSSYYQIQNQKSEMYISSIVLFMIFNGFRFESRKINNFLDWGTEGDWTKYVSDFSTYFVDIDGTLISSTSNNHEPFHGSGAPLNHNIEVINKKFFEGKTRIILTTSRQEKLRVETEKELRRFNIGYHELIMGLPNAKRILINDFSETNPYPSAIAINLKRNEGRLLDYLRAKNDK
jgi:hypothetical protein